MSEEDSLRLPDHHVQRDLCTTRPAYRQGRKLTAVKVYTITSESQHLFVYGVPKINLRSELKSLCSRYGRVLEMHVAADYKTEMFTECYRVRYERIQSARMAKRLLDNKSFYGGILHVCYAPEYESLEETKVKLMQRKKDVLNRLKGYPDSEETGALEEGTSEEVHRRKRKFAGNETSEDVEEASSSSSCVLQTDVEADSDDVVSEQVKPTETATQTNLNELTVKKPKYSDVERKIVFWKHKQSNKS